MADIGATLFLGGRRQGGCAPKELLCMSGIESSEAGSSVTPSTSTTCVVCEEREALVSDLLTILVYLLER